MKHREMARGADGRLGGREALLILAFWTFLALLSIANRVIDPRGPGLHVVPPSVPILLTLAETGLWAALTPLVFGLAARFSPGRRTWPWRLPLLLLVGLALALGVNLVVDLLRTELLENVPRRADAPRLAPGIRRLWFLNDFVIYLGVLAAGFARDYFRRYEARNQEALRLRAEAAALQAQLAEAQVAALRMQLNPHFLFNTLHAVSALVGRDPAGVRRMIARLSELLRSTLEESGAALRTVERELEFVTRYLDIMQVRFQGKLETRTVLDPDARDALVPTLILQPLVENAVKHGVSKRRTGGVIEVAARRHGERVRLTVRDNGPGPTPRAADGDTETTTGIGLRNTAERLRQMYGEGQRLAVEPAAGEGTLVVVEVPYRSSGEMPVAADAPVPAAHGR